MIFWASVLRATGLSLVSAAFTSTTFVFGAGPLFASRASFGRTIFLGSNLLVVALFAALGWTPVWIPLLIQLGMVFVFSESENLGGSVRRSAFLALAVAAALVSLGVVYLAKGQGLAVVDLARSEVEAVLQQVAAANPQIKIDGEALLGQLPSIAVGALAIALWIGLLSEGAFIRMFAPRIRGTNATRDSQGAEKSAATTETIESVYSGGSEMSFRGLERRLGGFRIPDVCIWATIAAIAGAFIELKLPKVKLISLNAFNILALFYFFQGLSVVSEFFRIYRFSRFWRAIGYVLAVLQLFLAVSALGLLDFWFDFRRRMTKKSSAETI